MNTLIQKLAYKLSEIRKEKGIGGTPDEDWEEAERLYQKYLFYRRTYKDIFEFIERTEIALLLDADGG